jgi:ComF family protein
MWLWRAALDVLFPPRCPGCDRDHPFRFCSACLERVPLPAAPLCDACGLSLAPGAPATRCRGCLRRPPAFRRARACATYQATGGAREPLRAVLHRYKYERDVTHVAPLRELLLDRCPLRAGDYDVLVPVPLHLERLRWRGFNQAQMLAQPLARRSRRPLDALSLERIRPTLPQVRLGRAQRRGNVRGAFRVTRPERIRDRAVLLVDDVYTSGATADAAAAALVAAGAAHVDVLALAHAVLS